MREGKRKERKSDNLLPSMDAINNSASAPVPLAK
jgi:hypothetical protein